MAAGQLWLAEHAARLTGAVLAMWAAAPTAGALTPSWRGWAALATAAAIGWLTAALIAAVREPVGQWMVRRVLVPLWTWLRAAWARLRLRVTGHTGEVPTYAPFHATTRLMPVRDDDDEKPGQP